MGLLDKLWDDTVAGPLPDTGLSRLRRPPALRIDPADLDLDLDVGLWKDPVGVCSHGTVPPGQDPQSAARVTRSIRIRRPPPQILAAEASETSTGGGTEGSPPLSPATPASSSPLAGKETLWFLFID